MKIIFSRKGFDSSAGGHPSPIFPDGTLFSIPIPDKKTSIAYNDLNFSYEKEPIQKILNDITNKKIKSGKKHSCDYQFNKFKCHYDPMFINFENNTYMVLGQEGGNASHLINQDVKEGDIFLFWGWFKEVEKVNNKWYYKRNSPDIHLIWSYMEVEKRLIVKDNKEKILRDYPFLAKHPHIEVKRKNPNVIFLSKKFKKLKFQKNVALTDIENYKGRSYWKLPKFFNQPQAFSYLKNFIKIDDEYVLVKSPNRGQEFVLDLDKVNTNVKKEIENFIKNLS